MAKTKERVNSDISMYYNNLEMFFLKQKNKTQKTSAAATNVDTTVSFPEKNSSSEISSGFSIPEQINGKKNQDSMLLSEAEKLRKESRFLDAFKKYITYYRSQGDKVSNELRQLIFIHGVLSNDKIAAQQGYEIKYHETLRSSYTVAPEMNEFVRDMNILHEHGLEDLALQEAQALYKCHPETVELRSILSKMLLKKNNLDEASRVVLVKKKHKSRI